MEAINVPLILFRILTKNNKPYLLEIMVLSYVLRHMNSQMNNYDRKNGEIINPLTTTFGDIAMELNVTNRRVKAALDDLIARGILRREFHANVNRDGKQDLYLNRYVFDALCREAC